MTLSAPLLGCDLLSSAKATTIVAGLVVASPEIALTGAFDVPGEVVATTFVAERESATSTEEPEPVTGARVRVEFAGNSVPLPERGSDGLYVAASTEAPGLSYQSGQVYTFVAQRSDSDAERFGGSDSDAGPFGGSVTAPTRLSPASLTVSPPPTPFPGRTELYRHPKSTALQVQWQPQNGRYAYVTVLRADRSQPDKPQIVFDSRPKTAGEMLRFIVGTPPTSVTVPASTFEVDGAYAVLVVVLNKGEPQTNTFLGSPILAGSGEKIILAVGDFSL